MKEYAKILCVRHIKPHFNHGSREVHVVFDNQGSLPETPKEIDAAVTAELADHECVVFQDTTQEVENNFSMQNMQGRANFLPWKRITGDCTQLHERA